MYLFAQLFCENLFDQDLYHDTIRNSLSTNNGIQGTDTNIFFPQVYLPWRVNLTLTSDNICSFFSGPWPGQRAYATSQGRCRDSGRVTGGERRSGRGSSRKQDSKLEIKSERLKNLWRKERLKPRESGLGFDFVEKKQQRQWRSGGSFSPGGAIEL